MAVSSPKAKPQRTPLMRWLRVFLIMLGVVVLILLLAALGGYVYLRQSLPQTSGTVKLQGLSAPVEIVRDTDGVPHIYAQNEQDVLFGLGYVHAQDRLWQMEFQRRVGRGTLSEALGEAALEPDRFLRTLGVYRAAQSAYKNLKPEIKSYVDSYVNGINAFISTHSGSDFPPEFKLVGITPEAWNGADVLVWAKMMSWDLGGNYSTELLRTDLINKLGADKAAFLTPDYPEGGALILPDSAGGSAPWQDLQAMSHRIEAQTGLGGGITGGIGSNNWVVSGAKSTTGKPILADDPHLGFKVPAIWYMAELNGGKMHSIGATIPGLPGVVVGHNERIAWGVTNTGPDVQDLFREKLDATGTMVEYKGQMEPLTIISDTITVKDKGLLPLTIRVSRHGPLISDALNANNDDDPDAPQREALAFRWTSLNETDDTMEAFVGINFAQNWEEFKDALRPYVAPVQNFVYADVDGNIGYYAPGLIPIRASGEGLVPAEGWTGANDWTGYIPFDQLPQAYNPPQNFIATANNRVIGPEYPYMLSREWAQPFRANRITALLTAKDKLSVDDIAAIQADQHSLYAETMLPLMLQQVKPTTDQQKQAIELLKKWDYNAKKDSAATAIFEAWAYYLAVPIFSDELGDRLMENYGGRRSFIEVTMGRILANANDPWCDNITTSGITEDCSQQVTQALDVALKDLNFRMENKPMEQWQWGTLHIAHFPHDPLDAIAPLRGFFSKAIPNGGDGSTVNVAAIDVDQPFDQTRGPIYRHVVDLSNLANSRMINAPGQAGHFMSPHYDDLLERWQAVQYIPMRFDRTSVDAAQAGTLRLEP